MIINLYLLYQKFTRIDKTEANQKRKGTRTIIKLYN